MTGIINEKKIKNFKNRAIGAILPNVKLGLIKI